MSATPVTDLAAGAAALAGQTVVLVGGSEGMGLAGAEAVLRAGGAVHLVSRSADKLQAARDALAGLGLPADKVATSAVDGSEAAIMAFWDGVPAGSVHHLVVTAGPSVTRGTAAAQSYADVQRQLDAKLGTQWMHARYGAPRLADGGSITLSSGALSRRPGTGSTALAMANAALETLTKGLCHELGPRLRVNCLSPGLCRTSAFAGMPQVR